MLILFYWLGIRRCCSAWSSCSWCPCQSYYKGGDYFIHPYDHQYDELANILDQLSSCLITIEYFLNALQWNSCCATIMLSSPSVQASSSSFVVKTLDRKTLWEMQTPQVTIVLPLQQEYISCLLFSCSFFLYVGKTVITRKYILIVGDEAQFAQGWFWACQKVSRITGNIIHYDMLIPVSPC